MRFYFRKKLMEMQRSVYNNNRTAIVIHEIDSDDPAPYAVLTVNLGDHDFPADELAIKTWSENKEIAEVVFNTGLFEDTGKRATNDLVNVEFWKFLDPSQLNKLPVIT